MAYSPGTPEAKDLIFQGFWVQQTSKNRVLEPSDLFFEVLGIFRALLYRIVPFSWHIYVCTLGLGPLLTNRPHTEPERNNESHMACTYTAQYPYTPAKQKPKEAASCGPYLEVAGCMAGGSIGLRDRPP